MAYSSIPIPPNFYETMQIDDRELRAETALRDGFLGKWLSLACSGDGHYATLGKMLAAEDER